MDHAELLARHRAVMPDWLTLLYDEPIELVRGEGRHVWDGEGRRYLDAFGGILTTLTGHGVPEVVAAVQEQAARLLHSSTLYLNRPMVELAELLASIAPMPDAKVFFTTSGTEANEAALLLACCARRSSQVIALRNGYHGRSFATTGVTGNRGWSPTSLTPLTVAWAQSGYTFRSPFRHLAGDAFVAACVDDLRDVLATCTAGDVACLIAEPVQGVGGFAIPPPGFLAAYADVCREHGILLVVDEVQTAWGRTGTHLWGVQHEGVVPDLVTFAKGVGNGLTLSGVIARADVMDGLPAKSISTFGGNPLSTAGALANLRYVLDHDLPARAATAGARLAAGLAPLVDRLGVVGEIRARGLMAGVELVGPDGWAPAPDAARAALEACRRRGVLIGGGGLHGNCLRIAPPLTITDAEVDEVAAVVAAALEEVDAGALAAR
jgi:4-aminobutyrate aminotransferase